MVHQSIDLVLSESKRVPVHVSFANRAIDHAFCRLLHKVKYDGSFAEANVFVADGPPAPALPAAVRPAHNAGITHRNRGVAPLHREVIVHKEIGSPRIANL